jgi:carotenoid cleavage dioxygenase-like enzyme
LYELFTGDGIIQGIFFKDGEPTYKKYKINTEKQKFETKFGKLPQNLAANTLLYCMNKMHMIPNLSGRANTAIMKMNHSYYALFERDMPYQIRFDLDDSTIQTVGDVPIAHIDTFSAHSKIIDGKIHTIDYDILLRRVHYYELDQATFQIQKQATIPTMYLPVIHDFLVLQDSILILDSPFYFDLGILFSSKIPVSFDKTKPAIIQLYNLTTHSIQSIPLPRGLFLFHYADCMETENQIELYASMYEDIDFSNTEIFGKYKKVTIDKSTYSVVIESNPETDQYNIDFPVKFGDKQILLTFWKGGFDGFVVLDKLTIQQKILWKDRHICGEPAIVYLENCPFLIGFSYDSFSKGYFFSVNLETMKREELPLNETLTIGFHSLFYAV